MSDRVPRPDVHRAGLDAHGVAESIAEASGIDGAGEQRTNPVRWR